VIVTNPIRTAYHRKIIRTGRNSVGGTGLASEPEYNATHPALKTMLKQSKEVYQEIAQAIDATTDGPVDAEASRNPRGAYSDFGGGIQNLGKWTIQQPSSPP
jgi:hypothetical protein